MTELEGKAIVLLAVMAEIVGLYVILCWISKIIYWAWWMLIRRRVKKRSEK